MEITDVQITLCDKKDDDRLRAYCAIVFDDAFVVHNVRIIEKDDGLLVAMPSRKLSDRCSSCGTKNRVDALFCSSCGGRLRDPETVQRILNQTKIYYDVAHPIKPSCRQMIERRVLEAYRRAVSARSGL